MKKGTNKLPEPTTIVVTFCADYGRGSLLIVRQMHKSYLTIIVLVSLILGGCQQAMLGRRPIIYGGNAKSVVLNSDYVWTAGFANVRHEFAAGEYVVRLEDSHGYYYIREGSPIGIYVTKDRTSVYGFSIVTPEERQKELQLIRPGTLLVAKTIGLDADVGEVGAQIIVKGDWKKAFEFRD